MSLTPSIAQMNDYGYHWLAMRPLSVDDAKTTLETGATVYKLYPDNTEALADSLADIDEHAQKGGMFGQEIDENTPMNQLPDLNVNLAKLPFNVKDYQVVIQIPFEKAFNLRVRFNEMNEIYADTSRSDWFEADDLARTLADDLGTLLDMQSVVSHADVCPRCGSTQIIGDSVDIEFDNAIQPCECLTCGHHWHDVYALVDRIDDTER